MSNSIYLDPSAGNPAVIKIGDTCYTLVGPSSTPPKEIKRERNQTGQP